MSDRDLRRTSLREMIDGLPDGWTGLRWLATGWVDCRTYVQSPKFAWEMKAYRDDEIVVEPANGDVRCTDARWCPTCPTQLALAVPA